MLYMLRNNTSDGWIDSMAVPKVRAMTGTMKASFLRRSRALIAFLDVRMETLILGWIGVALLLGVGKILLAVTPIGSAYDVVVLALPYLLVAAAPVAGYRVAAGSFPKGLLSAQPAIRLCRYGSWQQLDLLDARRNPAFGATGFMASLVLGILLNVPVRTLEFMTSVPAIGLHAPDWAANLMILMTADLVVMNFFYMVCFVMALRAVPLFPRMMVFAWIIDITLQLTIAAQISHTPGLPVAVADALAALLQGNIQKVLISAAVWLPYIILSDRVNVTFRQRVRR